ncbi:hypothetical protein ACFWMR_01815 [Amycolatopsis thailandensis]|uniref:hypothetical protein n=1 Tax=Amycolatopsis thailandensis TaxID=589330 RepID=UPI00364F5355
MPTTEDPSDPRLTRGVDSMPTDQAAAYLVLSDEERAKGFVRPLRRSYVHTRGEQPCQSVTTMTQAIAETYATDPHFYGATYCVTCRMHLPVGEFVWDGTSEVVGS